MFPQLNLIPDNALETGRDNRWQHNIREHWQTNLSSPVAKLASSVPLSNRISFKLPNEVQLLKIISLSI